MSGVESVVRSADWFPFDFNEGLSDLEFVRLGRGIYDSSSFLDERVLPLIQARRWVSVAELRPLLDGTDPQLDYIFHIGHVGSTLLSRVLGQCADVFSLREPAALRVICKRGFQDPAVSGSLGDVLADRLRLLLQLWSRTYDQDQRSLLKATSFVGEIATEMLQAAPSTRAVLMLVAPHVYIAGILAGPASRAELKSVTPERLLRLERRTGELRCRTTGLSDGECAAAGWAAEMLGLAEAANSYPERVLWLDFERFLQDRESELLRILQHLHRRSSPSDVRTLAASPEFLRYSKAREHAFDANWRRRILAQSSVDNAGEIERGLAWLNAAGSAHPAIANAARAAAEGIVRR